MIFQKDSKEYKQVMIVNLNVKMDKGKVCAQVAHASISAYLKSDKREREEWEKEGMKKIVLKSEEKELLRLFNSLKKIFPCALIKDAGKTQVKPGSITCLGIGPSIEGELDKYLSHLKLF